MRSDKQIALKLRMEGKSYGEIQRILGVPKSTLSGWFSNLILSDTLLSKINERTHLKSIQALINRNKQQTIDAKIRKREINSKAASEIKFLSRRDLLLLGATLYWAEGYKRPIVKNGREVTHHSISLTNSDPILLVCFIKFLTEYCDVPRDKIKLSIRIFSHQNEKTVREYWQNYLNIIPQNISSMRVTLSRSSMGKRPFDRLPYGVAQLRVYDTNLFHRVMGYIDGLKRIV